MTAYQRRDAPLFAAVAVGLLAVTVALVTALWAGSVSDSARAADRRAHRVVDEADRLTGLVVDAEAGERGYLLTAREPYLDAYNRAEKEIPGTLGSLQELASDGQEASLVANLRGLTRLKLDEMARAILVRQRDGLRAARDVVESGVGRRLMDEIRARSQELQTTAEQTATGAASRADRAAAMARTVGFSAGGLALVLLTSMLALLVQRQRLESEREVAERARARLSEQLADAATRDPLTALPNRRLVEDRLSQALHRAQRDDSRLALLLLDLDGFAHVNESMGHTAGDILLGEVAERLEAELTPSDTLGRWGGDQFVALCEGIATQDDATRVAERLRAAVAGGPPSGSVLDPGSSEIATSGTALGVPAPTADGRGPAPRGSTPGVGRIVVTASVGVVISSHSRMQGGEDVTPTPQLLLSAADSAMHQAKERGGDCVRVYDRTTAASRTGRYQLLLDLRRATADAELWLAYQPQVELDTGHVVGLEALVRWQHPARGQIPPAEFIPLAEDSGLIVPLGARILRQACERAGRWNGQRRDLGLRPLKMSVNVSARQLFDPSFVDITRAALDDAPLLARNLTLEITETALVEGAKPVTRALDDLAGMGVTLALDDFGTGYSSLAYLRQFPIGLIKIDRSFTAGMVNNDADLAIVRTIIGLADNLERPVLAEGIETAEQAQQLRLLGCPLGQGYCYGRPMPGDTIEPMLLQETVLMR